MRRFAVVGGIDIVKGWQVVPIVRALAQAVCDVAPRTALGLLDSARHRGLITIADLVRVRELTSGRRGSRGLAPIWDLVDPRRESPLESWAYFDLWRAGLEPSDIQVEFRDRAGHVFARADIGFELDDGSWHLIELDGREFHAAGQRSADDDRDNRITLAAASRGTGATTVRYRGEHLGLRGAMVTETAELLRGRTWSSSRAGAA